MFREKAAKALSGIVNVGAVDADSDRSLGGVQDDPRPLRTLAFPIQKC